MKVYYSNTGNAAHYFRDCFQLQRTDKDSVKTADEEDINRHVCQDCKNRQAFTEVEEPL